MLTNKLEEIDAERAYNRFLDRQNFGTRSHHIQTLLEWSDLSGFPISQ